MARQTGKRDLQTRSSKYAPPAHLQTIAHKTGLSEIEWASAWLPVMAIEEGLDIKSQLPVGMRAHVVKRSDLATRLGLDASKPLGSQLVTKGVLSYDEGRIVDGAMFANRLLRLRLRVDDTAENVPALVDKYKSLGLIEEIESEIEHDGYLFVELATRRFLDLARTIAKDIPGLAVLLSINESILSRQLVSKRRKPAS